jgi:ketosteroid isomerase-like protein
MDEDLDQLSREMLIAEARRLREGIRAHRDSTGQDLCWHHPALWGLLPERSDPQPTVPDWPEFLHGCIRYRRSLDVQLPQAPRSSVELPAADPKLVVLRFNEVIGAHDLEGLIALSTEDHLFVDPTGHEIRGGAALREAWRELFSLSPGYRNELTSVCSRGDVVFALGCSRWTEPALEGPAIWRAVVRDGRVAEWRVYTDSEDVRRTLGLTAGELCAATD